MGSIGDIFVTFTADTAKLDKAFNDTHKKLKTVSDALTKAGKKMTTFVTAPILGAGIASLKSAADMEKYTVAMEVMLGSAEKAKNLLGEIEEFSASTPFQFPDLVQGANRLMGFGVEADKVVETMRNLGNVAKGEADILDRLTLAYGKLRAKGKASLEELNMFSEAGVPILAELSRMYGVTTDEMFEYISAGKVGFDEVNQALQNMTTGEGQFAGMIEKQSQTLSGAISTMKDNLMLAGRGMVEDFLPQITEAVQKITEFAQKVASLNDEQKDMILKIAGIVAVIGPALLVMGKLVGIINSIRTAMVLLNGTMLANPYVVAIAGVVALGGAIFALTKNLRQEAKERKDLLEKQDAGVELTIEEEQKLSAMEIQRLKSIKAMQEESLERARSLGISESLLQVTKDNIEKTQDQINTAVLFSRGLGQNRQGLEEMEESTETLTDATEELNTVLEETEVTLAGEDGSGQGSGGGVAGKTDLASAAVVRMSEAQVKAKSAAMLSGTAVKESSEEAATSLQLLEAKFMATYGGIANYAGSVVGSITNLWKNYYDKQIEMAGDNEEQVKQLKLEQARKEKGFALFNAIITGAEAILGGFASKPFLPVGLAMGALATTLTGLQIAAIASQPLPMAKEGGYFTSPYIGAEAGNGEYAVPDTPEYIQSLAGAIATQMGTLPEGQKAGGGMSHITVQLGSKVLYDEITEATRNKKILISSEALI